MKAAALRHWRNGHAMDVILGGLWDPVLAEGIPSRFLAILSGLSDDGTGGGGASSGRPTSLGSDILHCGDGSLSIPDALDGEPLASHGLAHRQGCTAAPPAKHSTPSNRGGSA